MLRRTAVLATIFLLLAGCVSIRTLRTPASRQDGAGIAVRIFESDEDKNEEQPSPPAVVGELQQRGPAQEWVTVFRSLDPTWAVLGLAPGEYRLHFPARLDESGHVVEIKAATRRVEVYPGEVTQADVVLEHVPAGAIAVGAVAVVLAAVLFDDWLDGVDVPVPPLPTPAEVDLAFFITSEILDANDAWSELPATSPVVTSTFPKEGQLLASSRPRIVFAFSEPIATPPANVVTVLAEEAGLVAGSLEWDPGHWWLVWTPDDDLPHGDALHVTLRADGVEDLAGTELEAPHTFTFRTAP